MDENAFDILDRNIKSEIIAQRSFRDGKKNRMLDAIPFDLRFLAESREYHIKEIMSLCKGDYRDLVIALLMKENVQKIKGITFINLFSSRPLCYVYLLSVHPQAKAKVSGKYRFITIKFLMKHPRLLDLAKKIKKVL
jgi:hypothetical protein